MNKVDSTSLQGSGTRINYIDAMRGFTMILVVFSHICTLVLDYDSFINLIFMRFRMPLFFFISGFMVYSAKPYTSWIQRRFKNRLFNQFLPTFFTGFLFLLFTSTDIRTALFDSSKSGYWFTIVLFEMFIVYLLCAVLTDHLPKTKRLATYLSAILLSGIFLIIVLKTQLINPDLINLLSLDRVAIYIVYFFIGIICKMYLDTFLKAIQNNYLNAFMLFFFVANCYFNTQNLILNYLTSLSGVYIIYRTFQYNKQYFSNQNRVSRGLSFIGKNTLPVYFLHYFIIEGINITNPSILHAISGSWLFELTFCLLLSLFVVILSLLLDQFIKGFKPIHILMFGPELKKVVASRPAYSSPRTILSAHPNHCQG